MEKELEKLRKEILATVNDRLKVLGIDEFEISSDELKFKEISPSFMQRIGTLGKKAIWAVFCGATWIIFLFDITTIPENLMNFEIRFPKTYKVAQELVDSYEAFHFFRAREDQNNVHQLLKDFHIVLNPSWNNDQSAYIRDRKENETADDIFRYHQNFALVSSGSAASIEVGSFDTVAWVATPDLEKKKV